MEVTTSQSAYIWIVLSYNPYGRISDDNSRLKNDTEELKTCLASHFETLKEDGDLGVLVLTLYLCKVKKIKASVT